MKLTFDYQEYIINYHPRFWNIWCNAVNADFESIILFEHGKKCKSRLLYKKHRHFWNMYCIATNIIFKRFDDLHSSENEFLKIQKEDLDLFKLFVKAINLEFDSNLWLQKNRNKKAKELMDHAQNLYDQYGVAIALKRNYYK